MNLSELKPICQCKSTEEQQLVCDESFTYAVYQDTNDELIVDTNNHQTGGFEYLRCQTCDTDLNIAEFKLTW